MVKKIIISFIFVLVLLMSVIAVEGKINIACQTKSDCDLNEGCCTDSDQCYQPDMQVIMKNQCTYSSYILCDSPVEGRQSDYCEKRINAPEGSIGICKYNPSIGIKRQTCYISPDTKESRACNSQDKQNTCDPGEGCCLGDSCKVFDKRPLTCTNAINFKCSTDSDCQNNILAKGSIKSICKNKVCSFPTVKTTPNKKTTSVKKTNTKPSTNIKCETKEDCAIGLACLANSCKEASAIQCEKSNTCGSLLNLGFDEESSLFVGAYCDVYNPSYKQCVLTYGPGSKSNTWDSLLKPLSDSIQNVIDKITKVDNRVGILEKDIKSVKATPAAETVMPPIGNCVLVGIYNTAPFTTGSRECNGQYNNMEKVTLKYIVDGQPNILDVTVGKSGKEKTYSGLTTILTYCCNK